MENKGTWIDLKELTSFPGVVEKVEGAFDTFPVRQMEEGVRNAFAVSTLQDVFRWKD